MAKVIQSIDVRVPLRTAYNQWTQFETFPQFMDGIEEVQQLDEKRLFWRANIMGMEETWEAVITEQTPDQRIAWESTTGATNSGEVSFHGVEDNLTRVMLQLNYEPDTWIESLGDLFGFVERRVKGDLERFRQFIEERGEATGAWRGEIEDNSVSEAGEIANLGQ